MSLFNEGDQGRDLALKVLDVKSVQSGIDYTITDITELRAQIEPIQRAVRDFHSLDEDLKGRAGSAIRAFYQDTHELFLIFLHQSLTDYENLLNEMKDAISTYEPNESGYVSQAYIENDVVEGFDKVKTQVTELTNDANSIIDNINDLVAIPEFDESTVMDDIQNGQKKAKDIVEELNILDEFEASQLEETKDDIQTMQTFLSNIESKFKSGDISIANYDAKSIQNLDTYHTIYNDIYNKEAKAEISITYKNINEMPMSEIEKAKEKELNNLSEYGKEILENVYTDLKDGVIDRNSYLTILNDLRNYDNMNYINSDNVSFSGEFLPYINLSTSSMSANIHEMPSMIYQNDDKESSYLVTGNKEQVSDNFSVTGGVAYHETDFPSWSSKDSGGKVGGKTSVSLIHTGMELDTDIARAHLNSDVLKGSITAQIGGSSLYGLNIPLPLLKGEATAYELQSEIYLGEDERWGAEAKGKTGTANAYAGVDKQSIGFAAKAAVVEGEVSGIIPIPFTKHKIKLTGGASGGSLGGEAKIGRETVLDLRALIGLKIGIEFQ